MTNVPKIQITDSGLKLPTHQEILSGVLADINAAFGGGLNTESLETPQGQLASSLAAVIADKNDLIAELVNQINPDYADGIMQDAIAKIYFLERKKAVDSSVECEFIGLAGTIIPKGFAVLDTLGVQWILRDESSILEGGRGTGIFTAAGVVSAAANTVNQPVRTITGLDRVNNPRPAIPGRELESRADFRRRRQQSVAANAHGTPQSVYSNVAQLDGVSDVYVVDNPKDEAISIGGVTLNPHSIYVAVRGGNDAQIAEQIWRYTGNGCDYNGNTTVIVYDHNYMDPKPSYEVKFHRPEEVPVYFKVTVAPGAALGYEIKIQNAIIRHFANLNLSRIGQSVFSADFFQPVLALENIRLLDIQISDKRTNWREEVKVGIGSIPTISFGSIEVVSA